MDQTAGKSEPQGWTPPKCYVHVAPDGSYQIVDADGKSLASPPPITRIPTNGDVTYTDPWGNEIPELYPPAGQAPPGFTPPTCYVDVKPDGSYDIVDSSGNLLSSPPEITGTPSNGDVVFTDPWGNKVNTLYPPAGEPPGHWPPPDADQLGSEYYVQVDRGGPLFKICDENGQEVLEPPLVTQVLDETGKVTYIDDDGNEVPTLPQKFTPPECYVHRAPDGSYQVVNEVGLLLPSPPSITRTVSQSGSETYTDPWGNEIDTLYPPAGQAPPGFTPPECYVHVAPDGSYQVVDADGNPFPSPPAITIDGLSTPRDPWGNEVPLLYPPAGQAPPGFTPPECYVHVAPDGSYQVVDADGYPLPSPPGVTPSVDRDGTYTDPWGNEIPPLYPPAGAPPEEWPPPDFGEEEPDTADKAETEEAEVATGEAEAEEAEVATGEAEEAAAPASGDRAEEVEIESGDVDLSEAVPSRAVDEAMAAGPEPGPAVLPTPLSTEDAVAIAEGEVSITAELEGKWVGPASEGPELLSEEPLAEGAPAWLTEEVEAEASEDELAFKFYRPLPADEEAQVEAGVEGEELEGKHFQPQPPPEQVARFEVEVEVVEEEPTFTEMNPVEEFSDLETVEIEELEPEEPDDLEP